MRIIGGKHEGDLIVSTEEIQITGMVSGNLIVRDSGTVNMNGMVCGDLILESGQVNLYGMVNGKVVNSGGQLAVYGSIHGQLIKIGGATHIDPKAVIRP